jgi:hypothetical protein
MTRAANMRQFRDWLINARDHMLQAPGMVESWSRQTGRSVAEVKGAIEGEVVKRASRG